MPLVTLSPFIISLQHLDVLFHIAVTRLEMPDSSLKISLTECPGTTATARGQAGTGRLEAHALARSRNPQKESDFAQALMKKIQSFPPLWLSAGSRGV